MHALIACSTFALAVTLAIRRPRIGTSHLRVSPAAAAVAGVICMMAVGTVRPDDVLVALDVLWRPLAAIVAIMITTAAAQEVGVIDSVAERMLARHVASPRRLFGAVFVLAMATASLLSNDAAILLLTPLVLSFVHVRYPNRPRLLVAFAFAVFMAAGVAPFVTSNPMNMVVASYAGLNFNDYAVRMVPVSLAGSIVSFFLLGRIFAADLAHPVTPVAAERQHRAFSRTDRRMLALLFGVLATYPLVAVFDGSAIWAVSAAGAVLTLLLAWHDGQAGPLRVVGRGVVWDVLIFLPAVFVLSIGLRNVGLVDVLASWYRDAGVGVIGVTAAVGSAVLNNHPMALINLLSLEARADIGAMAFLAALVGGDLGPRLLPTGSLAGLLWFESCRRADVHISPGHFMRVGMALTAPTLVVSLALLALF